MKRVILDTSFILTAMEYKIDVAEELRKLLYTTFCLVTIDKTFAELENKKQSKLAKTFIEKNKVGTISTSGEGNVDWHILEYATPDMLVATQDKLLKEKLKKRKISVITIRQHKYLTIN